MRYREYAKITSLYMKFFSVFGCQKTILRALHKNEIERICISYFTADSLKGAAPMTMWHHLYDRLAHRVHEPMSLASMPCSLQLLNCEERGQVNNPNAVPLYQARALLEAVQARIATEKSAESLLKFCQVLEDMRKELGEH